LYASQEASFYNSVQFFQKNVHREQVDHLLEHRKLTLSGTGNLNAKSYFLSELMQATSPEVVGKKKDGINTLFWVIEEASEAEKVMANYRFWNGLPVHNFASKGEKPISDLEKMFRLYRMMSPERKVVVIDPASFFAVYPSPYEIKKNTFTLKKGEKFDPMETINNLLDIGYEFSADEFLVPGTYCKQGGLLNVFVPTFRSPLKIEIDGVDIAGIYEYDQETQQVARSYDQVDIVPLKCAQEKGSLLEFLKTDSLIVDDEIDLSPEFSQTMKTLEKEEHDSKFPAFITFTAFPEEEDKHYFYLYYLSILKFQDVYDFLNDLREKQRAAWRVMIFSKHLDEL